MRSFYLMLMTATIIISVIAAADSTQTKISKATTPDTLAVQHVLTTTNRNDDDRKRYLRIDNEMNEDVEERKFLATNLLKSIAKAGNKATTKVSTAASKATKRAKFEYWFKRGETPMTIYKKLKLNGLDPAQAKQNPNYLDYLSFSALWRRKQ